MVGDTGKVEVGHVDICRLVSDGRQANNPARQRG